MRCLALADSLSLAGAAVTFVSALMPEAMQKLIAAAGHDLAMIPASSELRRESANWEYPPLTHEAQAADVRSTKAAVGKVDWVVVDRYLLDNNWHSAAREFSERILVIDDLANRAYDCDILLDQTLGRRREEYAPLVSERASVFVGPGYALLRPEFEAERAAALERREHDGPVRRVLVSMGSADPQGVSATVVQDLLDASGKCAIDVVLGPQATSLAAVRQLADQNSRVSLQVNSGRMAELMRDADMAVGAAGTTSWERCCLALPSICLVLADNQRLAAASLGKAGAALVAESIADLPRLLEQLIANERLRQSMAASAAALCDGQGARRIAQATIGRGQSKGDDLTIRPAQDDDCQRVWLWRNDPDTRSVSQTTAPVSWSEHKVWWDRVLASQEHALWIAEAGETAVAAVRFDRLADQRFEVSINLAPTARGSGSGSRILALACEMFWERKRPALLVATIGEANAASRRIFEKTGFVSSGALSNSGFQRYVLDGGNKS